jgi:uncharacterized protein (PEP-CTERM system associated)
MRVFAQAGRESANYLSQQMEASTTWATGVQWNPSRRTTLDAQIGERAFGRSHSLQAEYRTPRTVWRLFDSRDIAVGGDVPAFSRFGRLFDVLFAQFAAAYPDFADRAAAVDAYLRDNNLRADSVVAIGSLVSTSTISSRQGVSVGWRGPRSDIMATLSRSESRRADSGVVSAGDLSTSTWLRQHALTVLFTHRMGRSLVGTVTADMVRTVGDGGTLGGGERRTRQEGLRARVTGRITPRENWSLEARHTRFHVLDGSYNENALTASYSLQF